MSKENTKVLASAGFDAQRRLVERLVKCFTPKMVLLPLDNGWQIYRTLFGIRWRVNGTGPFGLNEPWITKSLAEGKLKRMQAST